MKKINLIATLSLALCLHANADIVVLGTDVINLTPGPTFTVSGNFTANDDVNAVVSGTVDLDSGNYTANAAGILVSPATSNTGSHPGQITAGGYMGFPFAAILIGNSSLGFFPLFPADVANGMGNSTPPTNLSVDETLGSIFGPSVTIPNGTVLSFEVNDIDTYNNSGAFHISTFTLSSSVPDAGSAVALFGLSLSALAAFRRRLV
jgi:hypothetical protein